MPPFSSQQSLKCHYLEKHFNYKLLDVLADIKQVDTIIRLRKEMDVKVIIDLEDEDLEEDSDTHGWQKSSRENGEGNQLNIHLPARVNTPHADLPEPTRSFLDMMSSVYGKKLIVNPEKVQNSSELKDKPKDLSTSFDQDLERSKHTTTKQPFVHLSAMYVHENARKQYNSIKAHTIAKRRFEKNSGGYAPHKWLCEGRLLLLLDPLNQNNMKMFQGLYIYYGFSYLPGRAMSGA